MTTNSFFDLKASATIAGVACLLYVVCGSIYRLYLSPIAKFPGPKFAALTFWYEFHYDVIKEGLYIFEIEKMHKKYGPIIRINPYDLHINDPAFYETVYSRNSPRDKSPRYTHIGGLQDSAFGTSSHRLHRLRRGALNPFFSKRMVTLLEPVIQSKAARLCSRIAEFKGGTVPLPIRMAYGCLTTDVITEYAMKRSYGHLEDKDFARLWCKTLVSSARAVHLAKHLPWLYPVMKRAPEWFVQSVNPGLGVLFRFQKETRDQIQQIIDDPDDATYSSKSQPTIFHELLRSDLPAEEKSIDRMWQEGVALVSAGSETTTNTLGVITFHLLDNPGILKRLKKELGEAMPDLDKQVKWSELEQLPYLTAVISEGLRLSYGTSTRMPRIAPDNTLNYHGWAIPPGTPVSMTSVLIHQNATIFPSPLEFLPDRWLESSQSGAERLDRYLVSFSKGSRQCLGINLAYAELYIVVANVFRRFDMELWDTTRDHVDIARDWFVPIPKKDSTEIKVLVN